MNKSRVVLEFIGSHGEAGVRYTDIQKFICNLQPIKNWDLFSNSHCWLDKATDRYITEPKRIGPAPGFRRHNRGIWGTNLSNILEDWCVKNAEGRWTLFEWPMGAVYRQDNTAASLINKARRDAIHAVWLAARPTCGGCGGKIWNEKYDSMWLATRKGPANEQRCQRMGAGGYQVDCCGGVWAWDDHKSTFLPHITEADTEKVQEALRAKRAAALDAKPFVPYVWEDEKAFIIASLLDIEHQRSMK